MKKCKKCEKESAVHCVGWDENEIEGEDYCIEHFNQMYTSKYGSYRKENGLRKLQR